MDVLIEASVDSRVQSESKKSDEYYDDYEGEYEESQADEEDRSPVDINEDTLKKIERELCLVRLCWPRVELDDPYLAQLPESYSTNSDKEKLLMWYAENFRKQYHTIYKDRKPLLMVCDNECGVQKFVSTSVRPSTLPYPELYTWQGCAKFVSDHLQYQAPRRPLAMPLALRSPTWLMNVQRGNSFEYATLLVSLLLGQGYNAFVVSGYASREQVRCDMSMRACPYLPEPQERTPPSEPTDTSRYRMKNPPDFRSQLLLDLEAKKERKIEEESECREKERIKMLLEQERPLPDDYWGNRVHAWVVILPEAGGARDHEIRSPFFIEPSSGMSYSLDDSETNMLYHGVESLWNDRNYWVNMQLCTEACSSMDWDLKNIKHWEHLLPGEPWTMRGVVDDEEIDEDAQIQQDKHLDMPFSYVENIEIHSLDFERRYPNGTKTVHFKKTRVDFYAPYVQMDGLVRKITCYEDYDYRSPTQIYENYSNRADKLVESKKFLDSSIIVDFYERGRTDACKEHRYSASGNDRIDEERTLDFYDVVRIDGLSRIETGPLHLIQHYVGRKDFLYYRHVEYTEKERLAQHDTDYRTISKIIEKYNRNVDVPAINDIAIREFAIAENEIRLKYHYDKYNITRATRTFVKPPMVERGDRPMFNPEFVWRYNPDPMSLPEKQLDLFRELEKQLRDEAKCLTLVVEAEQEIAAFLKIRSSEFVLPKLTVSLFDRNRNEEAKAGMFAKEEQLRAQSQREVEDEVDYLGPYLARLGNPPQLTKIQASHVREQCLNDLKKTLTDRANRISQEFEACSRELNRVQNWFTQTEGKQRDEQERMLNETNEINFHLHTLDVRLQRHCDLATERYRNMLKTLRADKRLSVLYG